jgi:tetratricopeptide (TPR) repeat protein
VERLGCAFKRGMKLPTIEAHVRFCVRDFGEENRELCYMVNSWMDAPSRELGMAHRRVRHDVLDAPLLACTVYGDASEAGFSYEDKNSHQLGSDTIFYENFTSHERWVIYPTPKNILIAKMVLHHLKLDGLISPAQIKNWTWEAHKQKLKELKKLTLPVVLSWIGGDARTRKEEEGEDSVKMHKDANTLYEAGKHKEAMKLFLRAAELYHKAQNYFYSTSMLYKAGECAYALKDYEAAVEHFLKSAELSFQKGFDRFGVSALEYARDCYTALNKKAKLEEMEKKIKEVKARLEAAF